MANEKEKAYLNVCKEIANERINTFFAKYPDSKKSTYIAALAERLSRMYDDFFEAGLLNTIMADVVKEVEEKERRRENLISDKEQKPSLKICIKSASPEQAIALMALIKHELAI